MTATASPETKPPTPETITPTAETKPPPRKRRSRAKATPPEPPATMPAVAPAETIPPPAVPPPRFVWRGPETRDGGMYMAREDLLQVMLTDARALNAIQAVALHKVRMGEMARRHEAERQSAELAMASLTSDAQRLENMNKIMWLEASSAYGVDFTRATYDDETGRITPEVVPPPPT